jgi:hypothetical protein
MRWRMPEQLREGFARTGARDRGSRSRDSAVNCRPDFYGDGPQLLDRQKLSILAPIVTDELHLSHEDYAFIVNAFLVSYTLMLSPY